MEDILVATGARTFSRSILTGGVDERQLHGCQPCLDNQIALLRKHDVSLCRLQTKYAASAHIPNSQNRLSIRLLLSNPRESKITPILAQPLEKVKLAAFTVLDPLHRLPA
jgi:hypothetical protein